MVISLRSASTWMRPAHFTCSARQAWPSAHACTSLWRSVSSTCSTSEPGIIRPLPTSKIRTESTKPLPFAAELPTSTFWQWASLPTSAKQAASCGSQSADCPSSTTSLSSGDCLATSKKVFCTDSRYALSAAPPCVSLRKGEMQSEVSLSSVRSSGGSDGPGSGSTSAVEDWAAGGTAFSAGGGGGAAAGVPQGE